MKNIKEQVRNNF